MAVRIIIAKCSFCGEATPAAENDKTPACDGCEEGFLMPMYDESFEVEETYHPIAYSGFYDVEVSR